MRVSTEAINYHIARGTTEMARDFDSAAFGAPEVQEELEIHFKSDIDVNLITHIGGDNYIAAAARTSVSPQDVMNISVGSGSDSDGLIRYLMKHRHGSPFEHGQMTFHVHAPVFVFRQWHRHRIGSYSEQSGRYSVIPPVFYLPGDDRELFKEDNWKAARPEFRAVKSAEEQQKRERLRENLRDSYRLAYSMYIDNTEMGIDPGLARACLPVGIYSECWVTVNPRALMHFLSLRRKTDASAYKSYPQSEIDMAAQKCEAIFSELFPSTHKAFIENGRVAP